MRYLTGALPIKWLRALLATNAALMPALLTMTRTAPMWTNAILILIAMMAIPALTINVEEHPNAAPMLTKADAK
jgi:hypothetical protein